MPRLNRIILIFIITFIGISTAQECDETIPLLSKCYGSNRNKNQEKYQWLVEVPKTEGSCEGKTIAEPKAVPCDFKCKKGETFDRKATGCKSCPKGTFSLGGGQQYTFSTLQDINSLPKELSLKAESTFGDYGSKCLKENLWQIKGNILQGDVQPNCIVSLVLQFKLIRPGSVRITYNLPTSIVIGTITSRCDFSTEGGDSDDEGDGLDREKEFSLRSTGYGTWNEKTIGIEEAGEYELTLFTMGINAFHFPFAIRSIVVEGTLSIQECTSCPPGTFSSKKGSDICEPCSAGTSASEEGSESCKQCNTKTEYSDEGSTKCLLRPTCEAKHYRKVFTGCDTSDTASITYEPIKPQICINGGPPPATETSCATCNPGMYKNKAGQCVFCPTKTYSNGTITECLPCGNELSLVPGLYYQNWNELPMYLNRSYMSFDDPESASGRTPSHSWIPSITYISSQALPDTLSVLSLQINDGFRETDMAKTTKEYGRLYFEFSTQCQSPCSLFLVSQDIFSDNDDQNWEVLSRWTIDRPSTHTNNHTKYSYSIQHHDPIVFSWMFTSDDKTEGTDEIRIYEIRVTNTKLGGSDRCVTCLNLNNEETECKACTPGNILSNNTCIPCPPSSIASRVRPTDLVPTICLPCPTNTVSDDGVSCYIPCKQTFNGPIEYDLNAMSTIEFHGSKLFTQKGSGYFHVFNASICGKTNVICAKTPTSAESKRATSQTKIESKLCRMGSAPDKNENVTAIAYIDDFGEQLSNVSLTTTKYFPALRSDYNLTDVTLVYRANGSSSQSFCSEHITYLSLRCDHTLEDKQGSSLKYQLQTPNDCSTGTCDGCTFYFLLRTPLACPACDKNTNGYRTFVGPCKFGRQEVRKIPYPYCAQNLTEQVETRRCSILSIEIQIVLALFLIIAGILIAVVIFCWRKNRKLEYRYMQLIENNNPDDDTAVDNVCAQLSDEDDSGEEVQFKSQSKAKKILNVVRNAIRKNPTNGRSDEFHGDSFLLTTTSTNDA